MWKPAWPLDPSGQPSTRPACTEAPGEPGWGVGRVGRVGEGVRGSSGVTLGVRRQAGPLWEGQGRSRASHRLQQASLRPQSQGATVPLLPAQGARSAGTFRLYSSWKSSKEESLIQGGPREVLELAHRSDTPNRPVDSSTCRHSLNHQRVLGTTSDCPPQTPSPRGQLFLQP